MDITFYPFFLLFMFLPTFIANAIPVLIKNIAYLKDLKKPINEKLLWKNKTWRWLIFWILFAIIVSISQFIFLLNFDLFFDDLYFKIIPNIYIAILFWFLQWFWALFWDAVKSLIKRKIWIKPWKPWPVFDWIDYIIWSLIFSSFIFVPHIYWIIFLIVISPIASLLANSFSYMMWWKDVWW